VRDELDTQHKVKILITLLCIRSASTKPLLPLEIRTNPFNAATPTNPSLTLLRLILQDLIERLEASAKLIRYIFY
jgi:hypothetical protein